MTTRRTALQALAAAACWSAAPGFAQDDKSVITVVVGAGSSMDFAARLIADRLHETLGRTAVVLDKLGAGQRLAVGYVKEAPPDGRTLLFCTDGPFAIYPNIYNKLEYDPVADFTPIAGVSSFDIAIVTGPMTGATNLKQLIEWQRTQNGPVFASAPGNGSLSHFLGISIGLATGVQMTHVAYKDSGPAIADLVSSRLPMFVSGLTATLAEMYKTGKIRIVAVAGDQRAALVPEVPTLKESGIDLSSSAYASLYGPAKMAPQLVQRLYDVVTPMLSNAEVRAKLANQAMAPWSATSREIVDQEARRRKHFEELVRVSGFKKEDA
jgi:tripartite-type tricarboxylate transporter receptor subunit TctC